MVDVKKIAKCIREAVEEENRGDLASYMAAAMLEDLAQAWESYDAAVSPLTIVSDVDVACARARAVAVLAMKKSTQK